MRRIIISILVISVVILTVSLQNNVTEEEQVILQKSFNRIGLFLQFLSFVLLTPQLLADKQLTSIEDRVEAGMKILHFVIRFVTIFLAGLIIATIVTLTTNISYNILNFMANGFSIQVDVNVPTHGLYGNILTFLRKSLEVILFIGILATVGLNFVRIFPWMLRALQNTRPITLFEIMVERLLFYLADDRTLRERWTRVGIAAFLIGTYLQFIAI
jgi:hypothetical protein